ncbi:MAG: helix-turn-helix domain-containing protein [Halobacteriales archaeon]
MSTMQSEPAPAPLPDGLSAPLEKLVYLYVRQAGGATVYELRDALDVPQLHLYPTINRLADRDLVDRRGDEVRPVERMMG